MDAILPSEKSAHRGAGPWPNRQPPEEFSNLRSPTKGAVDDMFGVGCDGQNAKRRLAEPGRLVQHCTEHGREVAGRGIDDLQYVGRRGLSLQRLVALDTVLVTLNGALDELPL
jgi:hypothetical protein